MPETAATLTSPQYIADNGGPSALDLRGRCLHFVGIGGCGMSGLAHLARNAGAKCTGSDHAASEVTESLVRDGFGVATEQSADTLPEHCDLLIISAAIKPDHPEVAEARRRGVQVVKYAQLLGQMMIGKTGVAVAGTHGKSTATSLLGHVLIQAGLDPSVIVGATCAQIGGGARCGASDLLVAEACEFDRSFHHFYPTHALILNVEEDHLDMYDSIDDIVEAFAVFARKTPGDGTLLINHEMPHRLAVTADLTCQVETIGFAPQADWRVEAACGLASTVTLRRNNNIVAQWSAPLPGEHMAYNAAAAAVTAHRLGADWRDIEQAIAGFRGLDRRMQLLGKCPVNGGTATIVDDYGHHPTEIDTTLRALRRHYQPRRLICVFQPHQHSRTRFLLDQFAASFVEADIIVVPHIYFVRDSEKERHAVRAGDLVDKVRHRGGRAMHLYPFDAIVEQLELMLQPDDLVVTMGAGDVWRVARALMPGSA
ncbi:MAG: UDP-N-acetylmuramate--L-alanine ligase [Phycisphaeraceae bacterium]|jgi:UDP-N-acetylmuramate--alanine ligase|nr:UDP-N-acetylmuramate--L-alanine ligase [Phycisphaeraceae bacterium]MDP7347360.1 UDP-N-acetylmuramate--L-alanine ligase [Phycisphaeraceae bacterium]